ncbi:MAG: BrnA antitoxin family protein [Bacteroidales bacterium]|jgi:predicted DNA binding CopG/RHH family protein|nr:BrnA antitoxin family protein [Bacteroidales bacterium]
MKREIIYTDAPIEVAEAVEQGSIIADFLPKPNALKRKTKREKITIDLDKNSLEFFRMFAQKQGTSYQTLIGNLLDVYAHQGRLSSK